MKNRLIYFTLSLVTVLSGVCSAAQAEPIKVESRYSPSPYPDSCAELANLATVNYTSKWESGLGDPAEYIHVNAAEEAKEIEKFKATGQVRLGKYLAPVKSHTVFRERTNLVGHSASLFVNCKERLAYVSIRGGLHDGIRWFGPYPL
jgi:hypothetical protein